MAGRASQQAWLSRAGSQRHWPLTDSTHSFWNRALSICKTSEWREGPYLICHDGGHGPADFMVLLTFSYWSQQDKQKSAKTDEVHVRTEKQCLPLCKQQSSFPPATQKAALCLQEKELMRS